MPKKIQLEPSTAKWRLHSEQSVFVIVGLHQLRSLAVEQHELMQNLTRIINKAKALEIPIIDVYGDDPLQGMQRLGEQIASRPQLIVAGNMTHHFKMALTHIASLTEQICIVEDAVYLSSLAQHLQWIDHQSERGIHHMNTASLTRLWALTAPSDYILSPKGIIYAIAEQLDMEPLDIDPNMDLHAYGLDSVAQVTLVGLWRANGANIRYEDLLEHRTLQALLTYMQRSLTSTAPDDTLF